MQKPYPGNIPDEATAYHGQSMFFQAQEGGVLDAAGGRARSCRPLVKGTGGLTADAAKKFSSE